MQKKRPLLVAFMLVLISFSAYYIFSTFLAAPAPSATTVRLNFHDYSTGEPLEGLAVNFDVTTRTLEAFMISGVSDENGRIVRVLPTNDIAFPVSATIISISGNWVLEEVIGEESLSIADQEWVAANPQGFISDSSTYIFDKEVHLSRERNGTALNLDLDFYLEPGKLIAVYDPIPEARFFDYRINIDLLYSNFVKFHESNYAVIPVDRPLTTDLDISYYMLQWKIHISVDVGNKTFIDLTPSFIRAVSSAQIEELTRSLDNLKPHGFELTDQYSKISQISNLYDLAATEIEKKDYEGFRIHLQSVANSYRDLYEEIAGMYTSGLGWIPSLMMIFLFFSLGLSRLITSKKGSSIALFLTLFSAVFCLFLFTQPYLMLFVSNPLILIQSFTLPTIYLILFQLLPLLAFITAMLFSRIKSFIWETFEVGIRNLRRRKLKTVLALSTLLIVSASAMCLLTITTERPTLQAPYAGVKPTVDSGLVIYKIMVRTSKSTSPVSEPTTVSFHVPIQQHEIEWLSAHEWVEAINVYRTRKVRFERADGFVIEDFSTFNLIVVNASFMSQYQNVADALRIEWFEDTDKNTVIVGSRIAEAYDLETGSEVLINDRRLVVKSIVDEETAVERLKDIDGDLFLFKVFNPATGKIDGESFILGTLNDFQDGSFLTHRVSIILKSEYAQNGTQIARNIQGFGYDFGGAEDYSYVVTYSVHAISSDSVYLIYSSSPMITISGQWQTQVVPIIITTLVLVANTMGTVAERRSEVRTIYTIGASPLRVGFIFITEGLVLGIVGGVFGYVFGYSLVQYANIALPTLVKENIIGGAPFTIAISTATLASLLGCLLPSREAIRLAVPRGRLGQRIKDIIEIQEGEAHLKIPLKVERIETNLFRRFLEDLADEYSYWSYRFMSISYPYVKETREGTVFEITTTYISDEPASFLVSVLARPKEDLKVTIQPIEDIGTKKICRWSREHKNNINKLSPVLREEILRFTELKRKSRVSVKSDRFM